MISPDIILVVVLVIFIVFVLNLNIRNAKKIRNQQAEEKYNNLKDSTKTDVPKTSEKKSLDDSNYLHDIFNEDAPVKPSQDNWQPVKFDNPITLKEVEESEISKPKKSVGKYKYFDNSFNETDYSVNSTGNILNEQDQLLDEYEDYEKDYSISGNSEENDTNFSNALSEEFESLSPAMKAFIMSNMLKNKQNKNNDDNKNGFED